MHDTYLIFQRPSVGQSSADRPRESTSADTVAREPTSSVNGITATILGAPSVPLKIRVADTSDCRFLTCACLELLRRFNRVCAAVLRAELAFGDCLDKRPVNMNSTIDSILSCFVMPEAIVTYAYRYIPLAASFREPLVACFDLKDLFC